MNRGSYEWVNFLEKRQAVITYEDYYQNWKADPKDEFGTEITVTDAELQTVEAAGPTAAREAPTRLPSPTAARSSRVSTAT